MAERIGALSAALAGEKTVEALRLRVGGLMRERLSALRSPAKIAFDRRLRPLSHHGRILVSAESRAVLGAKRADYRARRRNLARPARLTPSNARVLGSGTVVPLIAVACTSSDEPPTSSMTIETGKLPPDR